MDAPWKFLPRGKPSCHCQDNAASYTQHKTDPSFSAPNLKQPSSKSHAGYTLFSLPLPTTDSTFPNTNDVRGKAFYASESTSNRFTPCNSGILIFSWMPRNRMDRERKVLCGNLYDRQRSISGYVLGAETKGQIVLSVMQSSCFAHAGDSLEGLFNGRKERNH